MARHEVDWWDVDAAAPNQVLTRTELHCLGVTQKMIWARVRAHGPWQLLLPGVILLRNGAPTARQKIDGALRYAGKDAVVTGLTAARLHGLSKLSPTGQVHVLIPEGRRRRSCDFVLVERTTRPPRTESQDGFPVAEITRAVIDAVRRMGDRSAVESLVADAVQRGFTTPRKLREELEAGSIRGSALPRGCLVAIDAGARSAAEASAVRLAGRSGIPAMKWNVRLRMPDGRFLASPDGWNDEVGLAWEIDSIEHHLSPNDYRRTLERHNAMTAQGIVVVHTVPSQLRTHPDRVAAELRAAYQQARKRPRPNVVVE